MVFLTIIISFHISSIATLNLVVPKYFFGQIFSSWLNHTSEIWDRVSFVVSVLRMRVLLWQNQTFVSLLLLRFCALVLTVFICQLFILLSFSHLILLGTKNVLLSYCVVEQCEENLNPILNQNLKIYQRNWSIWLILKRRLYACCVCDSRLTNFNEMVISI